MWNPRALLPLFVPGLLLVNAGSIVVVTSACDDGAGGDGGGEGEGEGEGEPAVETMELLEEPILVDVEPILANGIALAVRADGRFAFVYSRNGTGTVECQLFGGGEPQGTATAQIQDIVVVDEQPDGTTRERVIDSAPQLASDSLDIAVDPTSDALVVAYNGGEIAVGSCGASDLKVAVESGDTFTLTTVAQNSSDGGGPCNTLQNVCAQGDVVGRSPNIAFNDAGQVALSYCDQHFGFGADDLFGADLEIGVGGSPTSVNILTAAGDAGAGYSSTSAVTSDGRAVVGHAIISAHDFADVSFHEGIYMSVQQTDGTFIHTNVLENGSSEQSRIAVAAKDGVGIMGVVREEGLKQLVFMSSVDDGQSFQASFIERLGLTGFHPRVGVLSDDTIVVAYGHCRDDQSNPVCNTRQDGVRIAWRDDGETEFKKVTFTGDDEDDDSNAVDMAITPDDVITTLNFNITQSQVVIHRIHKVTP
jgi:hypothetical protein